MLKEKVQTLEESSVSIDDLLTLYCLFVCFVQIGNLL